MRLENFITCILPPVVEDEKQTSHYTDGHLLNKHDGEGSATQWRSPTAPTQLKSTAQGTCCAECIGWGK